MTMTLTDNAVDFPVLKPLSEATDHKLKMLRLSRYDFLTIAASSDMKHFHIEAICVKKPGLFTKEDNILEAYDGTKWAKEENWSPSYVVRDWFKAVPERQFMGTGSQRHPNLYKVAATDFSALLIRHCWPKDRMHFKSEVAKTMYSYLLTKFFAQNVRAQVQAQFKLDGTVAELPKKFIVHKKYPLSDYQNVALMMGLDQEGLALFMEAGTGKTPIVVNRVNYEALLKKHKTNAGKTNKKAMHFTLVVCPNQVRLNWQREFHKFSTVAGRVTVIRGDKMRRLKLLHLAATYKEDCAFTTVIVSFDTLPNDIEFFSLINWDLIVCDESHYFKSSTTKRWKEGIKPLIQCSKARMILTGTPMSNSIMDLWSQLEFLGEGMSGFLSFAAFRKFHGKFVTIQAGGSMRENLVGVENVPLLQERLARCSFSITKDEAGLKLPEKVHDYYEAEMTKEQRKIYDTLCAALVVEIEQGQLTGSITADHILTKLMRLTQITSGFASLDGGEIRQINPGANPKIEAVLAMLEVSRETAPDEKACIWAYYREDIKSLSKALTGAGVKHVVFFGGTSEKDREKAVDAFNNDPTVKVFIANAASAGEGLNLLGYDPNVPEEEQLPTYCGHAIYYSCNWSMVQRSQSEDRCHRRGTKMPVRITDLVIPDTIDTEIRARVSEKKKNAELVQDISSILKSVLDLNLSNDYR